MRLALLKGGEGEREKEEAYEGFLTLRKGSRRSQPEVDKEEGKRKAGSDRTPDIS